MSSPDQILVFLAAAVLLAVTRGPGIFYVAARRLSGRRPEGIASSFGTGLGGMAHVCAGAVGVSALVLASAELFTALKLLGAAYLVWMGVSAFAAGRVRHGVAYSPQLVRRLREASGAAMITLGLGLLLTRRPAT